MQNSFKRQTDRQRFCTEISIVSEFQVKEHFFLFSLNVHIHVSCILLTVVACYLSVFQSWRDILLTTLNWYHKGITGSFVGLLINVIPNYDICFGTDMQGLNFKMVDKHP